MKSVGVACSFSVSRSVRVFGAMESAASRRPSPLCSVVAAGGAVSSSPPHRQPSLGDHHHCTASSPPTRRLFTLTSIMNVSKKLFFYSKSKSEKCVYVLFYFF